MIGWRRRHGCTGAAATLQLVQNGASLVRLLANRPGPFVPLALFPEQRKLRFGSGGPIGAALRSISRGRRPTDTGAAGSKELTNHSNKMGPWFWRGRLFSQSAKERNWLQLSSL
jgi:hypothetical protein